MNKYDLLMSNITVSIPNRIHMFVADFEQLSDVQNIAGGMGVSIESENVMHIKTSGAMCIQSQYPMVLHFICDELKKRLSYDGCFQVIVIGQSDVHIGYGSTISLIVALCIGINRMFGEVFSELELLSFILEKYCEETDDGKLERVFDTGVGALCLFRGGINYIEHHKSYLHLDMPEDCVVASFIPKALPFQKSLTIEDEYVRLFDTVAQEKCDHIVKRRIIEDSLLPHMLAGDFPNIGKDIKALHQVGSKKVESSFYDYDLQIEIIDALLKSGALMAGLSSAGPTNYAVFHDRDYSSILGTIKKYCTDSSIRINRVAQKGVRVLK